MNDPKQRKLWESAVCLTDQVFVEEGAREGEFPR